MLTGVAVAGGFVLDAVFGDPAWLPHPVVWMGRCISALEKRLRAVLPKTPRGELLGGGIVAAVLPLGTLAVTGTICALAARLHPLAGLAVQLFWCAQALAARGLVQESRNVYKELAKGDLPAARRAGNRRDRRRKEGHRRGGYPARNGSASGVRTRQTILAAHSNSLVQMHNWPVSGRRPAFRFRYPHTGRLCQDRLQCRRCLRSGFVGMGG